MPELPKTRRKVVLITYSRCLYLLHDHLLRKILSEIPKLIENTQNLPKMSIRLIPPRSITNDRVLTARLLIHDFCNFGFIYVIIRFINGFNIKFI